MLNSRGLGVASLKGLSRIAVAIDGSDYSMKAAEYAIALAKQTGSELYALNVVDVTSVFKLLPLSTRKVLTDIGRKEAERMLSNVTRMGEQRDVNIKTEIIESSVSPADALVGYARKMKIDLLVVGTKGRSGVKKALLGSVASKVVTYSSCPVLVVK
jgi:nucleotide-binding universal stress UspA family protein